MICFYCGKGMDSEQERVINWRGYGAEIYFHPPCLASQVLKMRDAIRELRAKGWV